MEGRCQAQCPELVAAVTVITVGHVAECAACLAVFSFLQFAGVSACFGFHSLDSELRMKVLFAAVVFFQLILDFKFMIPFPKR